MFHVIMSRIENEYVQPKYGYRFSNGNGGQRVYYEKWIARSFDSLREAEEALNRINLWFSIDNDNHEWTFFRQPGYTLTGEILRTDVFKDDRHIIYEAYVDDIF